MPASTSTIVDVPPTSAVRLPQNSPAPAGLAPWSDADDLPRWPGAEEIDLNAPAGMAALSELDALWPTLSASARAAYLRDTRFTVSVAAPDTSDIVILPGGVVALCRPEGVLVPDPVSAITFTMAEAQRLQTALRSRQATSTLIHLPDGLRCRAGLPGSLEPQSATIVADASRLPKLSGKPGPWLVQWALGSAVAWSFGVAPAVVALAARTVGVRIVEGVAAVPAEMWSSASAAERADLVAVGITEQMNDLLADVVSDHLRCEILRRGVVGPNCLSAQIADVLGALPACFRADPSRWPGELSASWRKADDVIGDCHAEYAVISIDTIVDARAGITVLRDVLAGTAATLFLEAGSNPQCATVGLDSEAANFLVRRAGARGRIGILLPCADLGPVGLYAIAQGIALGADVNVTVAAPCWGFLHRVTGSGEEAGNAAWFGMGAGLDELDIMAAASAV